jgi:hypothetical protein
MDMQEFRTVLNDQEAAPLSRVARKAVPRSGDLLVSRRRARDVYAISVVPAQALLTTMRFEEATHTVGEIARRRAVDGWYTCDHTHFVPIARYRI